MSWSRFSILHLLTVKRLLKKAVGSRKSIPANYLFPTKQRERGVDLNDPAVWSLSRAHPR